MNRPHQVVIVGGGITGLSAAYYIQQLCQQENMQAHITLVEKSQRLGGKIKTIHRDGFIIEKGPDSFLARKKPIIELTQELGLEDELTGLNPKAGGASILHQGKLHRIPAGMVLGIPTQFTPFARTGLLSGLGKLRAALDLFIPRSNQNDQSLGGFLERRLGKEVVDFIAEPLLAGIYAGDTRSLSLHATFPQFAQMEQTYGSLIRGSIASKKKTARATGLPEMARKSTFLTYKNGLHTVITRLKEALSDVNIITGSGVHQINTEQHPHQATGENGVDHRHKSVYRVHLDNQQVLDADALILATPPFATAKWFPDLSSVEALSAIRYVSVANAVLAFEQSQINGSFSGTGFVVPRLEGRHITACTWTSTKWVHTAPSGKVLLRCYVGRSGAEEIVDQSDEEILTKVRHDLKEIMGITATPLFYEITRWHRSMPQYPLGHLQQLQELREELSLKKPGVFLCGAGYEGVGIPDCIKQGKAAAKHAADFLQSHRS